MAATVGKTALEEGAEVAVRTRCPNLSEEDINCILGKSSSEKMYKDRCTFAHPAVDKPVDVSLLSHPEVRG